MKKLIVMIVVLLPLTAWGQDATFVQSADYSCLADVTVPAYASSIQILGKNEIVGTIDWSDGTLRFKGNIDESAKVFFREVFKDCPCVKVIPQ